MSWRAKALSGIGPPGHGYFFGGRGVTLLNCSRIINSGSAWSSVVQYGADSLLCVLAAGGLLVVVRLRGLGPVARSRSGGG